MINLSSLHHLGLDDHEIAVYIAILELGEASIGPISARSGVIRTSIYNFIDKLVVIGLVTKYEHQGRTYYRAEDPAQIESLLVSRQRELEELVPELKTIYQASGITPTRISYYRTPEELIRLLNRPVTDRVKKIDYIWARDVMRKVFGKSAILEYKNRRIKEKIKARVIHPKTPGSPSLNKERDKKRLRELRYAPKDLKFSASMEVFGDSVSFISSKKEHFGLLIESSEYAQLCRVMFEGLWAMSESYKS